MKSTILAASFLAACMTAFPLRAADLPTPSLTPGVADPSLTKDVICDPGWSTRTVRHVPQSLKTRVYRSYGLAGNHTGYCAGAEGCEVDHLISLELGGANDAGNLWPQSYDTYPWNAHVKDRLENYLHKAVCTDQLSLERAQLEISSDWITAYRKYLGEPN